MSEPGDSADPNIGRLVANRFRIEAVLGAGSVGTVYRAMHEGLKRPVALKTLRASLASEPSTVARFSREAQLASQLDHPNIVHVFDHGSEADGLTYLAMELLEGPELTKAMTAEGPMAPARIVQLLAQVLSALSVAHRAGIVHRDLKPDNIMLVTRIDDDGRSAQVVKVTDFGIAKVYGETASPRHAITTFGTINGTPEYMSPEQSNGEDDLDGRSDLYACGAILYEMLCGHVPFDAGSPLQILEKHIRDPVVPPSARRRGVSKPLEAVALRALAKNRADRFADATAMRTALIEAGEAARTEPSEDSSILISTGESSVIITSDDVGERAERDPPSIRIEGGEPSVIVAGAKTASTPPARAGAKTASTPPARAGARPTAPPRRTGLAALLAVVGVSLLAIAGWQLATRRNARAPVAVATHDAGAAAETPSDAATHDAAEARAARRPATHPAAHPAPHPRPRPRGRGRR